MNNKNKDKPKCKFPILVYPQGFRYDLEQILEHLTLEDARDIIYLAKFELTKNTSKWIPEVLTHVNEVACSSPTDLIRWLWETHLEHMQDEIDEKEATIRRALEFIEREQIRINNLRTEHLKAQERLFSQ